LLRSTTTKRLIDDYLDEWRNSNSRKPLLIQGAGRVGKTHSVRRLGRLFGDFVEINFEFNTEAGVLFERDLDPERIIRELALLIGRSVIPGHTLLFFDEIQMVPRVLIALRYFL
jgi:uncharacterized protein